MAGAPPGWFRLEGIELFLLARACNFVSILKCSTVAQLLSQQLPDAVFLDGDKIVSQKGLDHAKWIIATVMTGTLRACELAHEGKLPIIAFPLGETDWKVITGLCNHAGVSPICISGPNQSGQTVFFGSVE